MDLIEARVKALELATPLARATGSSQASLVVTIAKELYAFINPDDAANVEAGAGITQGKKPTKG